MNRRVYILACVLWVSAAVVAQVSMHNLSRAQIDSIVHPTVSAEGSKVLRADKLSYDLGKMKEFDEPASHTFRLRNVSNAAMRISRVRTTCGCTVAAFDTAAIAPNGEATITLTYNPKNRPGTIDVDAFVYIEGNERQPMARLSLYGEVLDSDEWRHLPHTMGALRVKRKEVRFSELPVSGKTSMRVLCANSGNRSLCLTSRLLPPYAEFRTEPAVIAPGEEADLVVTIDINKLPKQDGAVRAPLLIEGVSGKPSERTLQLIIEK